MAEEIKKEASDAKTEASFTAIEEKALEQGWKPQDEWEGEPDAWRPAKEFLDRGELFKKIDDQNRTIKEFKRTLEEFSKHHAKVKETEYKHALEDLKRQKKEALLEGDADAVVNIDEKIDLVREAQRVPEPQVQAPQTNPIFINWVQRNTWYEANRAMRAFADRVGNELGSQGLSPTDILSEVERQVKQEFADKFNNPKRNAPSAVEGSVNKGPAKKDNFHLSDDERRVMQRFVRSGVLTEEQYIADLKKTKGVS